MRESSSCTDETHSLHGAAESFYAMVIVELVFMLIVNFVMIYVHCSVLFLSLILYGSSVLDNQTFAFLFYS